MEIIKLEPDDYAGKKFTMRYQTNGDYDIVRNTNGFQITYQAFDTPKEMSVDDVFFGQWLESPVAFGAFENGHLAGFVEGTPESWNNRFRINNICVFQEAQRHQGLGTALIDTILQEARASGARMAVLETQTCNEKAIAFYKKQGFSLIGFDLYAYTNQDPERQEVRLEMGMKLT